MRRFVPSGVLSVLSTPFTKDGQLDRPAIKRLVEHNLEQGVHGIVCFGLASEVYKLADRERSDLLQIVVETVDGAVPVVAGTEHNGTEAAVQRSVDAQELGADALMMYPPTFVKPSPRPSMSTTQQWPKLSICQSSFRTPQPGPGCLSPSIFSRRFGATPLRFATSRSRHLRRPKRSARCVRQASMRSVAMEPYISLKNSTAASLHSCPEALCLPYTLNCGNCKNSDTAIDSGRYSCGPSRCFRSS